MQWMNTQEKKNVYKEQAHPDGRRNIKSINIEIKHM